MRNVLIVCHSENDARSIAEIMHPDARPRPNMSRYVLIGPDIEIHCARVGDALMGRRYDDILCVANKEVDGRMEKWINLLRLKLKHEHGNMIAVI